MYDTATTDINTYCHTLSLHDPLPISSARTRRRSDRCLSRPPRARLSGWIHPVAGAVAQAARRQVGGPRPIGRAAPGGRARARDRSEEHTSELQSLMGISYDVFCLKKKTNRTK